MPARAKSRATAAAATEQRGFTWSTALQILAASAGLTVFAALIGGVMLWLRFDGLDLPADRAVEMLPQSMLLTVGVHAIAVPVILGAALALTGWLAWRFTGEDEKRRGKPGDDSLAVDLKQALGLGLVLLLVAVVLAQVAAFDVIPYWLVLIATLVLAIAAIYRSIRTATSYARIGWTVFAAIVITGGVLAAVRTWAAPKLEPAAVLLKGKQIGVSGFLIEQNDQHVYLAPLPGSGDLLDPFADADVDRILEIPRDRVLRLAVRAPAGIEPNQAGREQAQSLLADLRAQQVAGGPSEVEPVETDDPAASFAPLVHLHSSEDFWPISADEFLANSWLMWRHADCTDYSLTLDDHVGDRGGGFRDRAMGRFDPVRLGDPPTRVGTSDPYDHTAASACNEIPGAHTSREHTRPHDRSGRPAGVGPGEGFYLELAEKKLSGAEDGVIDEGAQRLFAGVPAYYERHPDPSGGPDAERITYWLFYANSQPPGTNGELFSHQGDWERISVLLRPAQGGNQWLPLSARYHFHNESREVPWAAVRLVGEGGDRPTHPVVYSAKGSHASFPRAGEYDATLRRAGANIVTVHDDAVACPDCPIWRTWLQLEDALVQPWYGFGGAWGRTSGSSDTTGPLGPSPYKVAGQERPSGNVVEVAREQPGEDDETDDEDED